MNYKSINSSIISKYNISDAPPQPRHPLQPHAANQSKVNAKEITPQTIPAVAIPPLHPLDFANPPKIIAKIDVIKGIQKK